MGYWAVVLSRFSQISSNDFDYFGYGVCTLSFGLGICHLEEATFSPLSVRPSTNALHNVFNIGLN